jgi:hypothetical protein
MRSFFRISSFAILLLILAGCGGNSSEATEAAKTDSAARWMQEVTDSVNIATKNDGSPSEENTEGTIIPKAINFDLFKKRTISIDAPFVPDSALKILFPGNFYKLDDPIHDGEFVSLEAWSSPDTKQKAYPAWFDEMPQLFPLKDSNETRFGDTLLFTDEKGIKNILISFSTTEYTTDLIGCGRFTCAILGLAWFTEENEKWNLRTFSPALGCYGSFQQIPSLNLLKIGKNNYGCYVDNQNGGAGGPFYADSYVFGVVNGKFEVILHQIGTGRIYDGKTEWSSDFVSTGSANFPEIHCITKGTYSSKESFDEVDDTSSTPMGIKQIIRTKEYFNFKITNRYSFENGKYVFKDFGTETFPYEVR